MQSLTNLLNKRLNEQEIPGSHLVHVSKPDKDLIIIKGCRMVTMQNTVGKLLENIVARRLAIQLEEDNLLPAILGSFRSGKDIRVSTAVLVFDIYDAFKRKEQTLVVALDLEDAYKRVETIADATQYED